MSAHGRKNFGKESNFTVNHLQQMFHVYPKNQSELDAEMQLMNS